MAVHIIGETPEASSPETFELPRPEVSLPAIEDLPAASYGLDDAQILELMNSEDELIRGYAIEQARARKLSEGLVDRLDDEDAFVVSQALGAIVDQDLEAARPKIRDLFIDSTGERSAQLASALGRVDAPMLLEASATKGRLDDATYAAVMGAAAISLDEGALKLIERGLSRKQLLEPDRRHALYRAAVISGSAKAVKTVLGEAIGESNEEAPEGQGFPNRAAVAAISGLGPVDSRWQVGEAVLERALQGLAAVAEDLPDAQALNDALESKQPGAIIRELGPLAEVPIPADVDEDPDLGSLPRRRQILLRSLVEKWRDFDKLETAAAGIFLAAAEAAAVFVASGALPEASSSAAKLIAEALSIEAETLVAESAESVATRFADKSPREMRRMASIMVNQRFQRASTFRRFATAAFRSGHGGQLIEAVSEAGSENLEDLLSEAAQEAIEDAETAVLEVLDERPLQEASTTVALKIGELLRTQRIGAGVAHRFFELRTINKGLTARIIAYSGLEAGLPLLESRAYEQEPEEAAWVLLSLVRGRAIEGMLAQRLDRIRGRRTSPVELPVELEVRCKVCGETGLYGFRRVYFDPDPESNGPDPAFVGDDRCKACHSEDSLELTELGERILTSHMVRQLEDGQAGRPIRQLVAPGSMEVGGKVVGLAAGLRSLNARLEDSPHAIRPRLERARLRILLERPGVEEDLGTIRNEDEASVEAKVVEATYRIQQDEVELAVQLLAEAWHVLRGEPAPRLYEASSPSALADTVEDLLLDLEARSPPPPEISLSGARRRRNSARAEPAPPPSPAPRRRGFARRNR